MENLPYFYLRSIWRTDLEYGTSCTLHWDDFHQVWSRPAYQFLT